MKTKYSSPQDFYSDFTKAYKKYWDEYRKIEEEIKQLNDIKGKLLYPNLEDELKKLAPVVQKALKADSFTISKHGTFSEKVIIYFRKGEQIENDKHSNVVGQLCFREYRDGEVALILPENIIDLKDITKEELIKFAKI